MSTKQLIFGIACLFSFQFASAQQSKLFIPTNLQRAIDRGTRTLDGKPGPN